MTIPSRLLTPILLLLTPGLALAAANITLETRVERQEIVTVDGEEQVKYIPSDTAKPGETLRFTLVYRNTGDETAEEVFLDNPVPSGTSYQANSASRAGSDLLFFSVDGGKTFRAPEQLTIEAPGADGKREQQIAPPESYTHIRWEIPPLPAGASGEVSFGVRVK